MGKANNWGGVGWGGRQANNVGRLEERRRNVGKQVEKVSGLTTQH